MSSRYLRLAIKPLLIVFSLIAVNTFGACFASEGTDAFSGFLSGIDATINKNSVLMHSLYLGAIVVSALAWLVTNEFKVFLKCGAALAAIVALFGYVKGMV